MKITIDGPGGIGLKYTVEKIIKAVNNHFHTSVISEGSPSKEDNDYEEILKEINKDKISNSYGNLIIHVRHHPWGG